MMTDEMVKHPGCGGVFVETRTASSTNGPWTCDKCGAITQSLDNPHVFQSWGVESLADADVLAATTAVFQQQQTQTDEIDGWTPVFERIIDVREQRTDDGSIIGDRVAVRVMKNGRFCLSHEDKLIHGDKSDSDYDWDWKVDPEAGLSFSREGAAELRGALTAALGEEDRIAVLTQALKSCVVDSFHHDLCGVCKLHLADCDETTVLDDWPDGNESLACAGARARVLLRSFDATEKS